MFQLWFSRQINYNMIYFQIAVDDYCGCQTKYTQKLYLFQFSTHLIDIITIVPCGIYFFYIIYYVGFDELNCVKTRKARAMSMSMSIFRKNIAIPFIFL